MLSFLTVPLSMLLIGPLAQHFGVRATMTAAGILYAVFAVASLLSRSVRTLPHQTAPAEEQSAAAGTAS